MENGGKKNILIITLALIASFFGFEYGRKTEIKAIPKEPEPLRAQASAGHQETAKDACPALFSQSADEYLASASEKSDDDCFIAGCGGAL